MCPRNLQAVRLRGRGGDSGNFCQKTLKLKLLEVEYQPEASGHFDL